MGASEVSAPEPAPTSEHGDRPRRGGRRWWLVAAVVVVAIALVAVYVVEVRAHSGSSSAAVLVPVNTVDSIPSTQFDGIAVSTASSSVINGSFYSTYGVVLYLMSPSDFHAMTVSLKVAGFEWSSNALVGNNSIVYLNVQVPSGAWVFVLLNPSLVVTTLVAFYSDLIMSAS